MNKDFSKVMSERTDRQLIDIVTLKREEYQPEAIVAAEQEIEYRKININNFIDSECSNSLNNDSAIDKSNIGFEWYHKALTVLLPATIIAIVTIIFNFIGKEIIPSILGLPTIIFIHYEIHRRLKKTGFHRLAKDFLTWVTYSLYIYIGLIIIGGILIFIFAT